MNNTQEELPDIMMRLAGGKTGVNPGAVDVLLAIMNKIEDESKARKIFRYLDHHLICGADLWIAYKDICEEDIDVFLTHVKDLRLAQLLEQSESTDYINPVTELIEEQ